jgi:hypothetical protein
MHLTSLAGDVHTAMKLAAATASATGRDREMTPTEISPTDDALARIGKLVAAAAPADRVTQAVGEIIASWAQEADMGPAAAQARIEQLWDSVSRDAADLQEQISDAAGANSQALAGAQRMLAALQAAVGALAAAHGRL